MSDERRRPAENETWSRRRFLQAGLAGGAAAALGPGQSAFPAVPTSEIAELGIEEMRAGLESGRFTARGLVEQCLARIGSIDRSGPALRSVLEANPAALAEAEALDRERRDGRTRGPLHGVPVLLKDNIDTAGPQAATAGSLALVGVRSAGDAFLVGRLRRSGAVVLGKTNLSEWANIRSPRSTSGWSARGGLTLNPYAMDRNTSGSSSGSAAAVAAGLGPAAVGTETDGSIVSPSSLNGIVGLKPTVGLVSRTGIIPIAASQDTAGPMARTVRDCAILLSALAGADPEDPATGGARGPAGPDYMRFLDPDGLRGARIGFVRQYSGVHRGVDRLMEQALAVLKAKGAVLVDPVEIKTLGTLRRGGVDRPAL